MPSAFMSVVFGATAAYLANKRGKNPYLWFVLGLLFGLFGLLFLVFDPKVQNNPRRKQDPNTIDITPSFPASYQKILWYYLDLSQTQQGPMSFEALTKAHREGTVTNKTFIWSETLDDWIPFEDLPSST